MGEAWGIVYRYFGTNPPLNTGMPAWQAHVNRVQFQQSESPPFYEGFSVIFFLGNPRKQLPAQF